LFLIFDGAAIARRNVNYLCFIVFRVLRSDMSLQLNDLADGGRARDSLDQAVMLAGHLNANVAKQLIVNADSAYDIAYRGVVLTGAAVMAALGMIYARFLRPTIISDADARGH
jgi:hypothetical protein